MYICILSKISHVVYFRLLTMNCAGININSRLYFSLIEQIEHRILHSVLDYKCNRQKQQFSYLMSSSRCFIKIGYPSISGWTGVTVRGNINIQRLIYGKNIPDSDHLPRKCPSHPRMMKLPTEKYKSNAIFYTPHRFEL